MTSTGDLGGLQGGMPSGPATSDLSPADENLVQRWLEAPVVAAQHGLDASWQSFAEWFASSEDVSIQPAVAATFLTTSAPPGLAFMLCDRATIQAYFGRTDGGSTVA